MNPENARSLAETIVAESIELYDSTNWEQVLSRNGVTVAQRDVSIYRHPSGALPGRSSRARVSRATVKVEAPAADVFALASDPARAGEWDPLEGGFEAIESYGEDDVAVRTAIHPPFPMKRREAVLLQVRRPKVREGLSLYVCRAITHRSCPPRDRPRVLQPIFFWVVRELGDGGSELSVFADPPENLFPGRLIALTAAPGWISILSKIRKRLSLAHPLPRRTP